MFDNLTSRSVFPSLNGLRAFEAMGRTGSATLAAAELHVTHSAVSRQVKTLEAALKVRLFEGPRHRLTLTEIGADLLAGLTPAFDAIDAAVRATGGDRGVQVAVNASLAVKWLIPRLSDFERRQPDVAIHLSDLPPHATAQRGADVIIRYMGPDSLLRGDVEVLAPNMIGLVCAPGLVEAASTGGATTRLSAGTHPTAWSDWAAASGQRAPAGRARSLAHMHFVLDATLAGLGVAVLPWTIAADDIRGGRLVAPFGFVPDGGALAMILPAEPPALPVRKFLAWLRDQGRALTPTTGA
jgi:LysR family glycine cleavage system transcriptional activator